MLNKTYLLTGSRDPGFRPWYPLYEQLTTAKLFGVTENEARKHHHVEHKKTNPAVNLKGGLNHAE